MFMIGILKTSKPLEVTDNKKSLTARFAEKLTNKLKNKSSSSAGGLKGTDGYVVLMPAVLHVFPGILKFSKHVIEKDLKNSTPNIFVVLLRSLICGAFSASPSRVEPGYPVHPSSYPGTWTDLQRCEFPQNVGIIECNLRSGFSAVSHAGYSNQPPVAPYQGQCRFVYICIVVRWYDIVGPTYTPQPTPHQGEPSYNLPF